MYRGTIAFDDDDLEPPIKGRNSAKRQAWYQAYWKTEKYRTYKREYMRKRRASGKTST